MRGLVVAALVASLTACNGGASAVVPPPVAPVSACNAAPSGRTVPTPATQIRRVYQPDWAGPVLFAPGQVSLRIPKRRFCAVEGEWTVPYAKPTINCSNPNEPVDGSSLWIAIDGWSGTFRAHQRGRDGKWHTYPSTDILQAGSESDVHCYHGGSPSGYKTTAYFWIEWSGVRNIRVTRRWRNLPLKAGDVIYVRIAAATTAARMRGKRRRCGSSTRRRELRYRPVPFAPAASTAARRFLGPQRSSAIPSNGSPKRPFTMPTIRSGRIRSTTSETSR